MSIWEQHDIGTKVEAILRAVPTMNDSASPPYVSAYQLAIAFQRDYAETFEAIGKPLGGRGTGQETSVAQYLANELSRQIRADPDGHYAEVAFVSNRDVKSLVYRSANGRGVESSLVEANYDMSLFRLRP